MPGLERREFGVLDVNGDLSGECVSVRHVRLHRNLHQESERTALTEELEGILREGLGPPRWRGRPRPSEARMTVIGGVPPGP